LIKLVDWKVGKYHIKNLEIFTIVVLIILYVMAFTIKADTPLYNWIAGLSSSWHDLALASGSALLMAFIFSMFGNTSVLIIFPYTLIVFDIAQTYPNFWILGLVSGIGAGVGEVTSYIVGRIVGSSKKISESELGEKFLKLKNKLEKNPKAIPFLIFFFAATPLPDDVILVPFGIMKYSYWKSIIPCMLGKTVLCTIMAALGYAIGQNADFLNTLITDYPILFFMRLFVPSESINPATDVIQFSFIFIMIYIIGRLDFEQIGMKNSKLRKDFQMLLMNGGILTIQDLVQRYKITNTVNFQNFLEDFANTNKNMKVSDQSVVIDALNNKDLAYSQSFALAEFLNK
jgi:membrane protein YqaA with SNARE-associated domain